MQWPLIPDPYCSTAFVRAITVILCFTAANISRMTPCECSCSSMVYHQITLKSSTPGAPMHLPDLRGPSPT